MTQKNRSQHRQRDAQMEWANSSGLPLLLVALTVALTAFIMPDDVPLEYSKVEASAPVNGNQISLLH